MRRNSVPDPSWKSGPPEPKHTHSDHDIWPEDFGEGDIDGFGRNEIEEIDGEPLITIQEAAWCGRDGCEAVHTRRLLFTTDPLTDDEVSRLTEAADPDELGAYAWEHATRIDRDMIEIAMDDGENITVVNETVIEEEPSSTCHGEPHPPDPEPYGL